MVEQKKPAGQRHVHPYSPQKTGEGIERFVDVRLRASHTMGREMGGLHP